MGLYLFIFYTGEPPWCINRTRFIGCYSQLLPNIGFQPFINVLQEEPQQTLAGLTRSVGQLPTSVTVASAGPFTRPVRNRLEIIKCPSFTKRHTQESCARVFRRLNWSKNHTSIRQRDGKLIRWCFNVRQRAHSALLFVYWFVSRKRGIPARDAMNDGNLAFTSELLWLYPIRRAISFSDNACCS